MPVQDVKNRINLILTSQKRQHKKQKHTLLIHFVLAMLSTFLRRFNFGHFTFPQRTQPKKVFYCIMFRPPCAICLFLTPKRETGANVLTADQTLFSNMAASSASWSWICPTRNGLKNGEVIDIDLCLGLLWIWGKGWIIPSSFIAVKSQQ